MLKLKQHIILLLIAISMSFCYGYANIKTDEIDSLRAYLACQKDKTSQNYIKNKEKLVKLISQANIDYGVQARFNDIQRLIKEQKYNSAKYELDDLIENNIQPSLSYELLGDIYLETSKTTLLSSKYYKKALEYDKTNASSAYKLAKLYLKENKNIIGTEYLKKTIEISKTTENFQKIENLILYNVKPQNRYEANNFYEVLAMLYFKSSKYQEGYTAIGKALDLNPDDIFLKYQLGNILFLNNQYENAVIIYNSILKENPYDSQIRNSKAKALLKSGNILAANKEYLTILKQYPASNQARYGIYNIYKNKLSPNEIIQKFHEDDKNYITTEEEILAFIKFLNKIKDKNAAETFIKYIQDIKAQEKKKQEEELRRKQQEEMLRQKQEEELRRKQQEEMLRQKQEEELKAANKKKIQYSKIQQLENNESYNKKTVQKPTQNKEKQNNKAKTNPMKKFDNKIIGSNKSTKEKLELNNKELKQDIEKEIEQKRIEEEKLIEKIEKQKKSDINAAQKELQDAKSKNSSKYQACAKAINDYLKTKPINANIYIAIANTYKQAMMPYNALKYFNEAKKMEPLNSDIYYNIALTYMELNRIDDSKENLEKAINLNNDDKKSKTLLNFINQKIITSIINNAYNNFQNKKYLNAYIILDEGIKKIPNSAQLYYYRGLATDAMNRNAAAISDFQKTIELDPTLYMAYYQLGKSYEKINDHKSALIAYERFLSVEPDEAELINEVQKKVIQLGKRYY